MANLTSKEKAALRALAQRLKPALRIGRNGVSDASVQELNLALGKQELVKVAFKAKRDQLQGFVERIESATRSECVGGVGMKRSFYRSSEPVSAPAG